MFNFSTLYKAYQHLYSFLFLCITFFLSCTYFLISNLYFFITCCYEFILYRVDQFLIELFYFILVSTLGFSVLKALNPRSGNVRPRDLDLFFTSVSATTVSSMSTVEMEVFSNAQLIIMTILMFVGGEVSTSMVGLHFFSSKLKNQPLKPRSRKSSVASLPSPPENFDHIVELGTMSAQETLQKTKSEIDFLLKYRAVRLLAFTVLGYLVITHVTGISMVLAYTSLVTSAKKVLETKRLNIFTFSMFTVVSTFASCGFVPTNENMIVFRKNSGLLWILIPQVLLGNTLFPSFLRLSIWVLGKFVKKDETNYLMRTTREIGYLHLLPRRHSWMLVGTVMGFIVVQLVLYSAMEWSSQGTSGLSGYQKFVGALFQCVNSRHTGETIVDLSTVAAAVLVLFVVVMYFPPYTSFLPIRREEEEEEYGREKKSRRRILESIIFSQLGYLVIFIMIICITERKSIREDPLNFNVSNIIVEVISAYGNVGFTTGYSCDRRLNKEEMCVNKWYGFAGAWSDEGKVVLVMVMFFGRLKKFNMQGGRAWKLV